MSNVVVQNKTRLTIGDLPRDSTGITAGLKQTLVVTYNYSRKYPTKMVALREMLQAVVDKLDETMKAQPVENKAVEEPAKTEAPVVKQAEVKQHGPVTTAATETVKQQLAQSAQ